MAFLSACLYVLATYRLSLLIALPLTCLVLAVLLHRMAGRLWGYFLIPVVFVFGLLNVLTGPWLNAAFLQWAGTPATAVVVDRRDAGWEFNETAVNIHDVLLRQADGQEVVTQFDSMSASIWPVREVMLLPPVREPFVVHYVPGFARNIVIMSDASAYGKRWLLNRALEPVERARRFHDASPDNLQFSAAYRDALQHFLDDPRLALTPDQRMRHEVVLAALSAASVMTDCRYVSRTQQALTEASDCAQWTGGRPVLSEAVRADLMFDDAPAALAAVHLRGAWYWVRRDGHAQVVLTIDNGADDFSQGLVRGPGSRGMAYYDQALQRVLDTPYAWVQPFRGNYAIVCADCTTSAPGLDGHRSLVGSTWGVIDRQGREVVPPEGSLQEAMAQREQLADGG